MLKVEVAVAAAVSIVGRDTGNAEVADATSESASDRRFPPRGELGTVRVAAAAADDDDDDEVVVIEAVDADAEREVRGLLLFRTGSAENGRGRDAPLVR